MTEQNVITVVSGLPRSGTSMMMRMLEAGGLQPLVDELRTADEDNPKGYYELERVKQLEEDQAWLEDAQGKAVKIISALLRHLPARYQYKVIFMLRDIDEILASQKEMLVRRGEPTDQVDDATMAKLFQQHLARIQEWLGQQPNLDVLYVSYNDAVRNPGEQAARVNQFLGNMLDETRMANSVDRSLYRKRHA